MTVSTHVLEALLHIADGGPCRKQEGTLASCADEDATAMMNIARDALSQMSRDEPAPHWYYWEWTNDECAATVYKNRLALAKCVPEDWLYYVTFTISARALLMRSGMWLAKECFG